MTQWIHQITIAVPESLMDCANQLAWHISGNSADVATFTQASYETATGDKYSVACTRAKASIFTDLNSPLPSQVEGEPDVVQVQQAREALIVTDSSQPVSVEGIVAVIDVDPQAVLAALGLAVVEMEEV